MRSIQVKAIFFFSSFQKWSECPFFHFICCDGFRTFWFSRACSSHFPWQLVFTIGHVVNALKVRFPKGSLTEFSFSKCSFSTFYPLKKIQISNFIQAKWVFSFILSNCFLWFFGYLFQINPNVVFRHLFPKVVVTQKHKQSSQTFSALVHFLLIFANCCQDSRTSANELSQIYISVF